MLTTFNPLIYSGEQEKDKCGKLRDTQGTQGGSRFCGAYFISSEKECLKNVVCEKRGLIYALQIDGISKSVNERMDSAVTEKELVYLLPSENQ